MEQVSDAKISLAERLYQLELFFRSKGLDIPSAKTLSFKAIIGIVMRDSYIQAFSDIFFVLAFGLTLCGGLVLCTRKAKFKDGEMAE